MGFAIQAGEEGGVFGDKLGALEGSSFGDAVLGEEEYDRFTGGFGVGGREGALVLESRSIMDECANPPRQPLTSGKVQRAKTIPFLTIHSSSSSVSKKSAEVSSIQGDCQRQ